VTPGSIIQCRNSEWVLLSSDQTDLLRAKQDAWFARAYGPTRDESPYILDPADVHDPDLPRETFHVFKEKNQAEFGEYRTCRLVLEAWDSLPSSAA